MQHGRIGDLRLDWGPTVGFGTSEHAQSRVADRSRLMCLLVDHQATQLECEIKVICREESVGRMLVEVPSSESRELEVGKENPC